MRDAILFMRDAIFLVLTLTVLHRNSAILLDSLEQLDQLARRKRFTITIFEIPYFSIVGYNRTHHFRNPEIFKEDDIDLKIALRT